jgi:hypothetical protein
MKKIFLILIIQIIANCMEAQINIPQLSPAAKVEQQIGLDNAIIKYGRPSLRGRKLIGQSNIPYGKVWRMGANDVTSLELTGNMIIGGKPLNKGKYAFVCIPYASEWTIVINKDNNQWGVYGYQESKDVLRFKVKAEALSNSVETLSFTFEDVLPSSANIVFRWENVELKIPIAQDADAKIMEDIKNKTAGLSPDLGNLMYAAEYYLLMDRDLPQALKWMDQVLEKVKSPFRYNLKAEIAHKMGKCDIAKEAAKNTIPLAEKNGDAAAKALAEDLIKSCN